MVASAVAQTSGKLAQVSLTELLVVLLAQRASGALVLTEPSGKKSVFGLSHGLVTKARTPAPTLDQESPVAAIEQHVEWAAGRMGTTSFTFCPNLDVRIEESPVSCWPLALIWRSARHTAHAARVDRYLERWSNKPLVLHHRARLDLFALSWDELAALEPIRRGKAGLNELLAQTQEPLLVKRLLYVLALCRHLDHGDGCEPIGIDGLEALLSPRFVSSQAPKPPANDPPPPRHRSGVVHRRAHRDPPSESPRPQRSDLPLASLNAPSGRPRPLTNSAREPRSQDAAERALRQAEEHTGRYEFDKALPLAELAAVKRKGDPAAGALAAYLRVRCGKFSERRAERDLETCHRAVREHRDSPRFRYYRAWVLKAMDREEDAVRDFTWVLRNDPNHIDAARELHRHQQREEKSNSGILTAIRRSLTPAPKRSKPPHR